MFEKNCILIVDDSLSWRNMLNAILKQEGYQIEFAASGKEALKKSLAIKPDLVLLDVMLPDMDGFEVCRTIRSNPYTSLMPVIMVTALDDQDLKLQGLQAGADEFLGKPLNALEVKARIGTVLKLYRYKRLLYDRTTGLPNEMLFIDYIDNITLRTHDRTEQFAVLAIKLSNSLFLNNYLCNDEQISKGVINKFQIERDDVKIISYNREGYFIVLLDGAGADKATRFAEELVLAFNRPVEYLDGEILLYCKIGISLYPENGSSGNELINNARLAYKESRNKQSDIQLYNQKLEMSLKNNVEIATNLYNAIEKNELLLHFQPQIRVDNREIIGMEALVRWDSKKYGFVYPDFFIPSAEENGTILNLGNWVLKDSMRYLAKLAQTMSNVSNLSINVSALQFNDPSLESRILNLLRLYDLDPKRIVIEITESAIIASSEESQKIMQTLKDKGFKLSIDDFGTGQTSLAHLRNYPIDEIKIDKVFIRNFVTQKVDYEIVKYIIELAHTLNMRTVAEGVEEEQQVELLEKLGCDIMQGYYFSEPVSEHQMTQLLLTQPFRKRNHKTKIIQGNF